MSSAVLDAFLASQPMARKVMLLTLDINREATVRTRRIMQRIMPDIRSGMVANPFRDDAAGQAARASILDPSRAIYRAEQMLLNKAVFRRIYGKVYNRVAAQQSLDVRAGMARDYAVFSSAMGWR